MREGDRHSTFCWPNYVDDSQLTGGAWSSELPRDNMLDPIFAEIAQSSGLSPTSTQFDVILPKFKTVAMVALAKHNLSVAARWRVRLFREADATGVMWDSGWRNAWPSVYSTSELNWEDSNFWSGVPFEEDRRDFTPLAWMFADKPQVCRRVRIEIDNPTNPDGVVRIGRAFVANAWQPEYNASWGIAYGLDVGTQFEVVGNEDETQYADPKTPRRTVSLDLSHLSREEGFTQIHAMMRRQGLHKEVFYTESKTPGPQSFAKSFIGQFSSINPLANPYYATYTNAVNLREKL